jgi:hypothetical protein
MPSIKKLVEEFGQCCRQLAESLPHWEDNFRAEFKSVISEDEHGVLTMQVGHVVLQKGSPFAGHPLSETQTLVMTDPVLFCPFCGAHLQEEIDSA